MVIPDLGAPRAFDFPCGDWGNRTFLNQCLQMWNAAVPVLAGTFSVGPAALDERVNSLCCVGMRTLWTLLFP